MIEINNSPSILLAFANEREVPASYLVNLEQERKGINQALAVYHDRQLCEVHDEPSTSIDEIFHHFGRYRDRLAIFHYGGHAGGDELLLEDDLGGNVKADSKGLAYLLGQQDELKLVFLNGCSTRGQVFDMMEAGVPVVIATSTTINDTVAVDFAVQFYESLAQGATIREAFDEAKARAMTHGESPEIHHEQDHRSLMFEGFEGGNEEVVQNMAAPWGLYTSDNADLEWTLPKLSRNVAFTKSVNLDALPPDHSGMISQTISFDPPKGLGGPEEPPINISQALQPPPMAQIIQEQLQAEAPKKKKKKKKKKKVKIKIELVVRIVDERQGGQQDI